KVCAAAVIALIKGQPVNQEPVMMNTCYSFVDGKNVMHVASVHTYDPAQKTMVAVKGAGGVSDKASELEGTYAWGWAKNIWAEALASRPRLLPEKGRCERPFFCVTTAKSGNMSQLLPKSRLFPPEKSGFS